MDQDTFLSRIVCHRVFDLMVLLDLLDALHGQLAAKVFAMPTHLIHEVQVVCPPAGGRLPPQPAVHCGGLCVQCCAGSLWGPLSHWCVACSASSLSPQASQDTH